LEQHGVKTRTAVAVRKHTIDAECGVRQMLQLACREPVTRNRRRGAFPFESAVPGFAKYLRSERGFAESTIRNSGNCFFGACSAFTHVMACTLAESPCDPLHRKLRQLRCLRCRFDCYWVERTSSRAGVAPLKSSAFSRRTVTSTELRQGFPMDQKYHYPKTKGSELEARCPLAYTLPRGTRQNQPLPYWFSGLKVRMVASAVEQAPAGSTRTTASSSAQKPRMPVWLTESGMAFTP